METVRYRVLIVDDDAMTRDLVSTVLSIEGHKCETAFDGEEALDRVAGGAFDIVITDIVMPKMDGITLTRALTTKYPELPVMVMTGFTEEHSDEDALNAGASDFINKPFSIAEFSARFHKVMKDCKLAGQIKNREKELERIGAEMIAGLQQDSINRVAGLKKEIGELKKGLK